MLAQATNTSGTVRRIWMTFPDRSPRMLRGLRLDIYPTRLQHDYEILPHISGRGRYLGANIGVIVDTATYFHTWWGEGEVKVYLDGDRSHPTLNGTGTEDYIGTAWGQGRFDNLYAGAPIADDRAGLWAFYRYHIPDPIYFHRDIRVTIQQIGYLAAQSRPPIVRAGRTLYRAGPGRVPMDLTKDGKFERADDWSSCVYFYLDRPGSPLPPIEAAAARMAGL